MRKEFIDQEMIGSINPDFFCFEAESYLFHAKPYIDELYPDKSIVLWTYGAQVKVHDNEKVVSALKDAELTKNIHAIIVDYPDEMKDFFVNKVGVDHYPSTKEYLNLVYNISSKTTLPDKSACLQICTLFSVIGNSYIYIRQML